MMVLILFRCQFLSHPHSYFNPLHKTGTLMVTAELADRIDDLIHLSQGHPVHLLVQLCRDYEKTGFIAGIKIGIHLNHELN